MNTKITFNGREYDSIEELPPEARQAYQQLQSAFADQDRNGIPDIFEGGKPANITTSSMTVNQQSFVVDGQTYTTADDLPPEARAAYQNAMQTLTNQPLTPNNNQPSFTSQVQQPAPMPPLIKEDTSSRGWLLMALIMVLVGLAVVLYLVNS